MQDLHYADTVQPADLRLVLDRSRPEPGFTIPPTGFTRHAKMPRIP